MPTTPSQPENYFQFEKLLVALVHAGVDFAISAFFAVKIILPSIILLPGSWPIRAM
jgi:hypothetical protein